MIQASPRPSTTKLTPTYCDSSRAFTAPRQPQHTLKRSATTTSPRNSNEPERHTPPNTQEESKPLKKMICKRNFILFYFYILITRVRHQITGHDEVPETGTIQGKGKLICPPTPVNTPKAGPQGSCSPIPECKVDSI